MKQQGTAPASPCEETSQRNEKTVWEVMIIIIDIIVMVSLATQIRGTVENNPSSVCSDL